MQTSHKSLFGSDNDGFDSNEWSDPGDGSKQHDPGAEHDPSVVQTAAIGDLGTIASFSRSGTPETAGAASDTSIVTVAPTEVTTAGSGLIINLDWDASVSAAPAGFTSDMIAAAQFLESEITSPVTVNLDVGYDEIGGSPLDSGTLGESESNVESVSYSALVTALKASASTDPTDAKVLASLPATSPVSGTYWVTTAQAKALGLSPADGSGTDGAIGFGPSSDFTFGLTNAGGAVAAGTYDFFATAVHEMTETMGRVLLVGSSIDGTNGYSLLDLLHYSAPGTRDFAQSTPGYFSVNSGATDLGDFNTIAGGDPGDWASTVANNSFDAYATPGAIEAISSNDILEMDAIGWNLTGSGLIQTTPSLVPPEVTDQTGAQTWTEGQAISLVLPANTFADPEGEPLTYEAGLSSGAPLPSWLTFNRATETFTGTAPSTTTSLSLKVTATDTSGLSGSETFTAKVVAPIVEAGISVTDQTPAQTWIDGQSLELVLPADTFTDALGLKMTFAAYEVSGTNITSWLRFNPSTDTFSGLVPSTQSGSAELEVIARDARNMSAADLFTVTFAAGATISSGAMSASAASASARAFDHLIPVGSTPLHIS